jgi:ribose 5-phosphate isomerase B
MKIYLATDHAGFTAKESVKEWLVHEGYVVEDCGAYALDPEDDYPDYMHVCAKKLSCDVAEGKNARAVVFGASGQGEAMVLNKYPHVRAAVYYGQDSTGKVLQATRTHNNANVLSIGARYVNGAEVLCIVSLWLTATYPAEERHSRRIAKIDPVYNSS